MSTTPYDSLVISKSPSIYWQLDDASGNIADASGNGAAGVSGGSGATLMNATLTRDLSPSGLFASGFYYTFSGPAIGTADYTIEFCFKSVASSLNLAVTSLNGGIWVGLSATGKIRFNNAVDDVSTPLSYNNGAPHHCVVTRNTIGGNKTIEIWIDGTKVVSQAQSSNATSNVTDGHWAVGDFEGGGFPFQGNISKCAVYLGALSDASIQENAAAAVPYTCVDIFSNSTLARICVPFGYTGSSPVPHIQYMHGMGETAVSVTMDALKQAVVNWLCTQGCIVSASSMHGDSIGNQQGIDDNTALLSYVQAHYNVSKTVLMGQSAGGPCALNFLRLGIYTDVVGAVMIYAVCSLSDFEGGAYQASVDAAYGTDHAGFVAASASYDPMTNTFTAYEGKSFRFFASLSDTVVNQNNNTDAFRQGMKVSINSAPPVENTYVECTGNHGDPSHFQPDDVWNFIQRAIVGVGFNTQSADYNSPTLAVRWGDFDNNTTTSGDAAYAEVYADSINIAEGQYGVDVSADIDPETAADDPLAGLLAIKVNLVDGSGYILARSGTIATIDFGGGGGGGGGSAVATEEEPGLGLGVID